MNNIRQSLALTAALLCAAQTWAAQPLPQSTPAQEGIDPTRLERMHDMVKRHIDEGKIAGASVLVARHGKIVDFQAFGKRDVDSGAPMERDTIVRIYSMTKVITSVAGLQLVEEGRLQLDSPVKQWLPELSDLKVLTGGTAEAPELVAAERPITVKMLFNHTAGFTHENDGTGPAAQLYKKADMFNSISLDDYITRVGKLPLIAQPGTSFHYSIANDVLGVLIQRVSGEPFEQYVTHHITNPLKMNDTDFDVPEEKLSRLSKLHEIGPDGKLRIKEPVGGAYAEKGKGIPSGGGGMFSTIDDYARFAQALLNGGQLDGARILGRKTVELARLNSLTALTPPNQGPGQSDGWGLMGAVRVDPARAGEPSSVGMFYWSGAANTHFFVDPTEDFFAIILCQHLPYDQPNLFKKFRTTVYQALE